MGPIVTVATPQEVQKKAAEAIARRQSVPDGAMPPVTLQPVTPAPKVPVLRVKLSSLVVEIAGRQFQLAIEKEFDVPMAE